MNTYDFSSPIPDVAKRAVVAIGNFDAVHLGHQSLLAFAKEKARALGAPLAVLTFEPHPRRLFRPDDSPFRVTPLSLKLERFGAAGVDMAFVCPFNWELAGLYPVEFVQTILKDRLDPQLVVVGHDFHFGHNRSGNIALLQEMGINVASVALQADKQHGVISATRVRGALQAGHMDEANALLGWNWEIRGVVGHGDKRGREIGYPTANVALGETIHPSYGVYATWVRVDGQSEWMRAATNIGIRPMFEVSTGLVEAHILDFSGDLYDKVLHIRPVKKIRDEMRFGSLEDLVHQIDTDCIRVREILALAPVV